MKLVVIVISTIFLLSCMSKKDRILPERMTLTESIYSSVTIQPESIYNAYAPVPGILFKNFVSEGDEVDINQKICQIVNTNSKLFAENAKLNRDLANEKYSGKNAILKNLEDEIIAATLKFRNDSITYLRQKRLWNHNIGSLNQFENLKLRFDLSKNNLKILKDNYSRTKIELENIARRAQNSYSSALEQNKDYTVVSTISGKVYALYKEPGEMVNSMEPLATLGSSDNYIIELLVDEVDIIDVKINQPVILRLEAYRDTIFKGSINKIYPKKLENNQTFKVEAIFKNQPDRLFSGLTGEANIIISEKENALTLPKEYLLDNNTIITDKGITSIQLGIKSIDLVEIISGLDEQTYVYKPQ